MLRYMRLNARIAGAAVAVTLATAACGNEPAISPSPLPAAPPTAGAVSSLLIAGPATVAPGATARYKATAYFTNGTSRDVTDTATWTSENPAVLSIAADGSGSARDRGQSQLRAAYDGKAAMPLEVFVLEDGTFALYGFVSPTPENSSIYGLRIVVDSGIGAGLETRTDDMGMFGLYGVAGAIQLTLEGGGRFTRSESLTVTKHRTILTLALIPRPPLPPSLDLTGRWKLAVVAPDSCVRLLGAAAGDREYDAAIEQSGSSLTVRLTSSSLAAPARLTGTLDGDHLYLQLYKRWFDIDHVEYDVLEQLQPQGLLGVAGQIAAPVSSGEIVGTFSGSFEPYPGGVVIGRPMTCHGSSPMRLRRQ